LQNTGSNRTHLAQGLNCIHNLAKRIEKWPQQYDLKLLGYPAQAVAGRFTQIVISRLRVPFMKESVAMLESGSNGFPSQRKVMKLHGLIVHTDSGRVQIPPHLFVRSIMLFFAHWGYVLLKYMAAAIKPGVAEKGFSATLIYNIADSQRIHNNSDERFVGYCKHGPIVPLAQASLLIVEATNDMESVEPDKVQYAKQPALKCVELLGVSLSEALEFLFLHLFVFWKYLFLVCRYPFLCLVLRDLSEHALMTWLNRRNTIENIALATPGHAKQLLWMTDLPDRHYRTHMVWYATNIHPFVYKDDQVKSNNPQYYLVRSDDHWVWTQEQVIYLGNLMKSGKYHVVGPIMFHLDGEERKPVRETRETFRIAIFDVTPVNPGWAREQQGIAYNYYCTDNAIAFIDEILQAGSNAAERAGINIEFLLKHKRVHHDRTHDMRYINYVRKLVEEDNSLRMVEWDVNIFSFLRTCDMAITIPYSSPAHVAKHVGISSIYYDPTRTLLPTCETGSHLTFENNQEALALAIENGMKSVCMSRQRSQL